MFKAIVRKIFISQKRRQFAKNAIFGKNCIFSTKSSCFNSGSRTNVKIGDHCYLLGGIIVGKHGCVTIGNNVYYGTKSYIESNLDVTIGSDVIISNNVIICDNNNHPVSPQKRLEMTSCEDYYKDDLWQWDNSVSKRIVIEDNVWIGRDSKIMKGVTIGRGSIVATGSVVTKDVPPYCIAAGNPAKIVKKIDEKE